LLNKRTTKFNKLPNLLEKPFSTYPQRTHPKLRNIYYISKYYFVNLHIRILRGGSIADGVDDLLPH